MKIKNEKFFLAVRKFLLVYLVKNRNCSDNTVKSYREALNLYFLFLETEKGIPLQKVDWDCFTYELVSEFLIWLSDTRGSSVQTQLQRLTAIRSFIRYAGILDITVVAIQCEVEKVKLRKPAPKPVEHLTKEQISVFLSQPDIYKRSGLRDMVFLTLMYDSAARCQELLDLRICDLALDGDSPCVYLTGKGSKTRVVPLMPKTSEHLRNYLNKFHPLDVRDRNSYVFFTVSHGERHRMSEDNVAAFVKKYGLAAKAACEHFPDHVHPHMIRHARDMHLYQDGVPLPLLSEFLGHAQVETTRIYAFSDAEMKRAAIQKTKEHFARELPDKVWNDDDKEMIRKLAGLK